MAHSHGHGCSHQASDSDLSTETGVEYSLYERILIDEVVCLNEEVEDSGKTIFKPYEKRLDFNNFVISDLDRELLINIPFTGTVKLKGLIIIGPDSELHPKHIKL